jgi:hypothetical protein
VCTRFLAAPIASSTSGGKGGGSNFHTSVAYLHKLY